MKDYGIKYPIISEYDWRSYIIDNSQIKVGGKALFYNQEEDMMTQMKIKHIIARSDNPKYYDLLDDDVLINGEREYEADTSAEFVTDNDCYLIWFEYMR